MSRAKKMFIQKAIKRPGALHKALHVPMDKKIPEKKLEKALHSSNPLLKKQANFAEISKGFNKGSRKKSPLLKAK
jgi:hypothetical protein